MPKTRRLSDLYVRGEECEIDDGQGAVKVWLAKLNTIDREAVFRRAHAAKARFLIDTDDEDGDRFAEEYGKVREFGDRDGLVMLAISEDLQRFRDRTEAELGTDEETWGKDGYLQGLFDSWVGTDEEPGFAAKLAEDPDDPEALKVKAEIDRFSEEVAKLVEDEHQRLAADWVDVPNEDLWRAVTHKMLEQKGMEIFVGEVLRQQVFFCVRELDRKTRYFGSLAEVDDLDDTVRELLLARINAMMVEPSEGKDSPRTEDSSLSSESPAATEEDSQPSGPEAVSV